MISADNIPYATALEDRTVYLKLPGGLVLLPEAFQDKTDGRSKAFDLSRLPDFAVCYDGGNSVTKMTPELYQSLGKDAADYGAALPSLGARCQERSRVPLDPVPVLTKESQLTMPQPEIAPTFPDFNDLVSREQHVLDVGKDLAASVAEARERANRLVASFEPAALPPVVQSVASQPAMAAVPAPPASPSAPGWTVVFSAAFGQVQAKYHEVAFGDSCIVLCYDTRFANGFQYLPPAMGESPLKVHIHQKRKEPYNCHSLGLSFQLASFDCVLLLIQENSGDA